MIACVLSKFDTVRFDPLDFENCQIGSPREKLTKAKCGVFSTSIGFPAFLALKCCF